MLTLSESLGVGDLLLAAIAIRIKDVSYLVHHIVPHVYLSMTATQIATRHTYPVSDFHHVFGTALWTVLCFAGAIQTKTRAVDVGINHITPWIAPYGSFVQTALKSVDDVNTHLQGRCLVCNDEFKGKVLAVLVTLLF
jgi:hypothetical protein